MIDTCRKFVVAFAIVACFWSESSVSQEAKVTQEAQEKTEETIDTNAANKKEQRKNTWIRNERQLTQIETVAYGNRAEFFQWLIPESRADVDWRSVLDPRLAEEEPEWSQGFEELIIRDYFEDRRDGVFLDVGCHLPRTMSTTYELEKRFDWTGIGIDVLDEFKESWAKWRPNSTFVTAAVSDKDDEILTLHIAGTLASLNKEVVLNTVSKAREIQVKTATLNTILERHHVTKVDFLSMDIEGAEPAALRGFDLEKFKPDLICIEAIERDYVIEYLGVRGYELIEKYQKVDRVNLYFWPKPQVQH